MPTLYFDWKRGKVDGLWDHSDVPVRFHSLAAMLDSLTEPTTLVCETPVESFSPATRTRLILESTAKGHTWRVFRPKATRLYAEAYGYTIADKSDKFDTWIIRELARAHPEWLKAPRVRDESGTADLAHVRAASQELNKLRNTDVGFTPVGVRGGKPKVITAKDGYYADLVLFLPDYATLTPTQKIALGDGKSYSKSLIPAVAMATKHSTSRRDFEQICGLFDNGYPTLIRSDIHHHNMRHCTRISRSEFRREVRWLYHRMTEIRASL